MHSPRSASGRHGGRADQFVFGLLFFTALFVAAAAQPAPVVAQQTGTVAGRVLEAEGRAPLPGANVTLRGTALGAATDAEGRFAIGEVPAGAYVLEASAVGYETARRDVRVTAGEALDVTLYLGAADVRLRGVEVTAFRPDLQPEAGVEAQQIRELDPIDTGELLRTLPGMGAARRGALGFDPNVRGLVETEVGTYIDGVRTFPAGPLRMDTPLSHLDPGSVERVEVVKGPYALTWGAGNMSAIRVETRAENPPPASLAGTLRGGYRTNTGGREIGASAAGTPARFSYSLHSAYREGDDYEAGDGQAVPSGYGSGSVRGRLGYAVAPGGRVYVSGGYQSQDDIDYPGRLLNANFFRTGTGTVSYEMERSAGLLRGLDVQAYALQTLHEMTNRGKPTFEAGQFPNGNPRPPLRIFVEAELQNYGGRIAADLAPTEALRLKLGGDVYSAFRNATRPLTAITPMGEVTPPFYDSDVVWPGVTITDAGLFANAERSLGPVRASATARLDLVRASADEERVSDAFLENAGAQRSGLDASESNLSGAATLSVPLSERWSASIGAGTVVRTADALERYADRFPASKAQTSAEFVGNPNLDPERSTQADLWLEGRYARFSVSLSGFARQMTDYITLAPTDAAPLLPLSPPTVFRYVNGEATFYGAEARAAYAPLRALTLHLGASYLWGQDERLDEPALGVMPPSADLGARVEPFGSAAFAETLYLEGTLHLVAEQTRVAAARGETPTDGYATADLRLGYSPTGRVLLRAGVENLTDADFSNHLNAKNPFTSTPLPEPGRVFFVNVSYAF